MARRSRRSAALAVAAPFCAALSIGPALAEMRPSLAFSGVPGLVDMPSGEAMPDGTFSISAATFGPITRTTLSFQIAPWLSGSFRLQNVQNWNDAPDLEDCTGGNTSGCDDGIYSSYNDRSFDLRFHVLNESRYLPSVTVGLQDFAGTGIYSGEYVAATKTFGDKLKVTGGLGWGRYGSDSSIGSPFGERPAIDFGKGGKPNAGTWFRGPASIFGGVEYQINDRWAVKAEYSTDAYVEEAEKRQTFDRKSPLNFGVEYRYGDSMQMGLYSLYGSEIGFSLHVILDPKTRSTVGVTGPAPVAVKARPSRASAPDAWDPGWVAQGDAGPVLRKNLSKYLKPDGIFIEDFAYDAGRVQVRIRNDTIDAGAQAVGRTARALSHVMPASVEVFEIVPVVHGIGASKVTVRRSDLEDLEYAANNDALLRERVQLSDAGPLPAGAIGAEDGAAPRLTWGVLPGYRVSAPARGDIGLRARASYDITPGLVLSGQAYLRLAENFDKINVTDKGGTLPHVRSDVRDYNAESSAPIERLQLAWYARPAANVYSRLTFGYLETMHAGLSGEVLWKPVESKLALGLEVNHTKQRDRDGRFGFDDYDYAITTTHVSAYYDFGKGYLGQVDVGRYLAGDKGATLTFSREFANGWKVGAFASMTDASAEEFGEGSFDKGVTLTVPMNWLLGKPSRDQIDQTIRPLQRDGGARVNVDGRLYNSIRDYHSGRLDDQWSRVWR